MEKNWNELTLEEKVEETRKDIVRTMGAVDNLALFREQTIARVLRDVAEYIGPHSAQ